MGEIEIDDKQLKAVANKIKSNCTNQIIQIENNISSIKVPENDEQFDKLDLSDINAKIPQLQNKVNQVSEMINSLADRVANIEAENFAAADSLGIGSSIIGETTDIGSGITFFEGSLGTGKSGQIGSKIRPDGKKYEVDRLAIYENGNLKGNINLSDYKGKKVDEVIQDFAKKNNIDVNNVEVSAHVSYVDLDGSKKATGWLADNKITSNQTSQKKYSINDLDAEIKADISGIKEKYENQKIASLDNKSTKVMGRDFDKIEHVDLSDTIGLAYANAGGGILKDLGTSAQLLINMAKSGVKGGLFTETAKFAMEEAKDIELFDEETGKVDLEKAKVIAIDTLMFPFSGKVADYTDEKVNEMEEGAKLFYANAYVPNEKEKAGQEFGGAVLLALADVAHGISKGATTITALDDDAVGLLGLSDDVVGTSGEGVKAAGKITAEYGDNAAKGALGMTDDALKTSQKAANSTERVVLEVVDENGRVMASYTDDALKNAGVKNAAKIDKELDKFVNLRKTNGKTFSETVKGAATRAGETVKGAAAKTGEAVKEAATKAGETVKGAAAKTGDAVKGAATKAGETVKGAAAKTGDAVREAATKAGDTIKVSATKAGEAIKGATNKAGETIKGAAGKMFKESADDVAKSTERAAFDILDENGKVISSHTGDAVKNAGAKSAAKIDKELDKFVNLRKTNGKTFSETVKGAATKAGETVKGAAAKTGDAVKEAATKAGDTIKVSATKAGEAIKEATNKVGETIKGAATKAGNTVKNATGMADDALKNFANNIDEGIKATKEATTKTFKGAKELAKKITAYEPDKYINIKNHYRVIKNKKILKAAAVPAAVAGVGMGAYAANQTINANKVNDIRYDLEDVELSEADDKIIDNGEFYGPTKPEPTVQEKQDAVEETKNKFEDIRFYNGKTDLLKEYGIDENALEQSSIIRDGQGNIRSIELANGLKIYDNGEVSYRVNGKEIVCTNQIEAMKNIADSKSGFNYGKNLLSIKEVANLDDSGAVINFVFEDGSVMHVSGDNSAIVVGEDKDGNVKSGYYVDENGNVQNISIFGNYNKDNLQFGGRQSDIREHASELLNDENIFNELERAYPGSSYEQKKTYLQHMANKCCGFLGQINGLFKQYEGREDEFKNTFGVDMYKMDSNGNLDFNYEYMTLKYYDYVYSDTANKSINTVNNSSYLGMTKTEQGLFSDFLRDNYNLETKSEAVMDSRYYSRGLADTVTGKWTEHTAISGQKNVINKYEELVEDGYESIMIAARNTPMYRTDGGGSYYNGSHAMYVVGEQDGTLVVSSFGREYELDLNSGNYSFYVTDYDVQEGTN